MRCSLLIPLEALRVLLGVAMLSYASWRDIKTREVSDITWIVFGSLGLLMDAYEVATGRLNLLYTAGPILLSTVLSFLLGYFGLFGGVDFKAFVILALLQPYPPRLITPALAVTSVIYPLTIFSNSALAGASFAFVLLFRNLYAAQRGLSLFVGHESAPLWRKFIMLISGMKVRLDLVRGPPFQYPLEIPIDEDSNSRKLILMPDIEDDEEALEIFEKMKNSGVEEIWVSHTLPFIVFILFGFISALIIGDIALSILKWILFS